jgi:hypothetical protein
MLANSHYIEPAAYSHLDFEPQPKPVWHAKPVHRQPNCEFNTNWLWFFQNLESFIIGGNAQEFSNHRFPHVLVFFDRNNHTQSTLTGIIISVRLKLTLREEEY